MILYKPKIIGVHENEISSLTLKDSCQATEKISHKIPKLKRIKRYVEGQLTIKGHTIFISNKRSYLPNR